MLWQQVIAHAETFRQLLDHNVERLAFEERQAVAQCLINKVIVTGETVDIHCVLPFASSPRLSHGSTKAPVGAPGHFYWLRLAQLDCPPPAIDIDHLPGCHVWAIGHEDLCRLRPIVALLLSQNYGDIADVVETSPFGIDPAGFLQEHPGATIMHFRQMRDESFQGLSIVKASRPHKRHHKAVPTLPDQLDICLRGTGRICGHDDHLRPGKALKAHQHPAHQPVLRLIVGGGPGGGQSRSQRESGCSPAGASRRRCADQKCREHIHSATLFGSTDAFDQFCL